jgi:hypothetical protein
MTEKLRNDVASILDFIALPIGRSIREQARSHTDQAWFEISVSPH